MDLKKFLERQKSFVMPDRDELLAALREIADRVSAVISSVSGEGGPTPPPLALERAAKDLCIQCGNKPPTTRGCCDADYQAARRIMRKEGISDWDAVERGLLLPEAPKGRPSRLATGKAGIKNRGNAILRALGSDPVSRKKSRRK